MNGTHPNGLDFYFFLTGVVGFCGGNCNERKFSKNEGVSLVPCAEAENIISPK